MGDAGPPQPSAGGFVPMLGVGMVGSVPGAVTGPISGTRGSAVPLHSAIVERLRARIELCRRHHSSCESRYQRGQAENSDRERESTLHLLNIVHQGPGNRKNKSHKTAAQQPPEYNSRVNGIFAEASLPPLFQKVPTLFTRITPPPPPALYNASEQTHKRSLKHKEIPRRGVKCFSALPYKQLHFSLTGIRFLQLQGSLRRKLEGNPPTGFNPKQNGISSGAFNADLKRLRVDAGSSLRQSGCVFSNGQSQTLQGTEGMGHAPQRKDNSLMAQMSGSDLFSLTLKEMKKEPGEVHPCSQTSIDNNMMTFDFKDESGCQIDPELQDLFDELTKSVPSLNDLEFEKILKQDADSFSLDLGRPSSAGMSKPSPQMEKIVIKTEYSPGFSQASAGSPQLRPASAGPTFSISTSLSSSPNLSQGAQGSSSAARPLTSWPEVSHAEQLKQIAANQQPTAMLHQQQGQSAAIASWSSAMSTHSSPGPFGQEKIPSPATLCQQRISPQNSILPPMGHESAEHQAIVSLQPQGHQPTDFIDGGLAEQVSCSALTQPHPPPHFQNHALPRLPNVPVSQCLQPKTLPQKMQLNQHAPGLPYKMAQQRQIKETVSLKSLLKVIQYTHQQSKNSERKKRHLQDEKTQYYLHMHQQKTSKQRRKRRMENSFMPSQNDQHSTCRAESLHGVLIDAPVLLPQNRSILFFSAEVMKKKPTEDTLTARSQRKEANRDYFMPSEKKVLPPGTRLPVSSSFANSTTQPPQPPSLTNQQKTMGKNQAMQRQMVLQQQILNEGDKMSPQDQLNRRLTRPPPDYKESRRNMVGAQPPTNQYTGGGLSLGMSSTQTLTNNASNQSGLQANSCHLPSGQGSKMAPTSNERIYGPGMDPQQGGYNTQNGANQLQQRGSQNPMGMNQNNPRFQGPASMGTNFGPSSVTNAQHMRPAVNQETSGMPGHRLAGMMTNSTMVAPSWAQGSKQTAAPPHPLGVRRFLNTLHSHQEVGSRHFPHRSIAPPNQVAPDISMRPLNPMNQAVNGQAAGTATGPAQRPGQPRMPTLSTMTNMNQLSPAQTASAGNFTASGHNPRPYQSSSNSGDLTFDFLQEGDNTVPGINTDSDFIDSLLKSGSGNDDWMEDINLDEILGSHS
uniref:Mastermind like transcriptional coactivator 2 n=1 Tax=Lepisosteus oculatus TaxID=7918 RepID=W5MER7_LEPOC